MNMMNRRKKYKFQVELCIRELEHVPLVNQLVFTKVRLCNGGSYEKHLEKKEVLNQSVRWDSKCTFECNMTANSSTGELDNCKCRISVRKELRGGRSSEKLGFVDVNLAEFAGPGGTHRFLLQPYDTKHRLLNSTLTVSVHMSILSGDPCFKAKERPGITSSVSSASGVEAEGMSGNGSLLAGSSKDDSLSIWTASGPAMSPVQVPPTIQSSHASLSSSGYSSLNKKGKEDGDQNTVSASLDLAGHSRNSSNTSHLSSQASGYVSEYSGHNRSSSLGSPACMLETVGFTGRIVKVSTGDLTKESRVEATRVAADVIVEEIFQKIQHRAPDQSTGNDSQDEPGLQLYVDEEGKPTVDSKGGRACGAGYQPVLFHKR